MVTLLFVIAILVAADVAVTPEADARGSLRLARFGEDFVSRSGTTGPSQSLGTTSGSNVAAVGAENEEEVAFVLDQAESPAATPRPRCRDERVRRGGERIATSTPSALKPPPRSWRRSSLCPLAAPSITSRSAAVGRSRPAGGIDGAGEVTVDRQDIADGGRLAGRRAGVGEARLAGVGGTFIGKDRAAVGEHRSRNRECPGRQIERRGIVERREAGEARRAVGIDRPGIDESDRRSGQREGVEIDRAGVVQRLQPGQRRVTSEGERTPRVVEECVGASTKVEGSWADRTPRSSASYRRRRTSGRSGVERGAAVVCQRLQTVERLPAATLSCRRSDW